MDKTLDRAWLLMESNRLDRSEQEIRKHLSENPDDPRAHTMLAMCLFDLSRYDEAIESGKKAIELVPENPYPYWVLGCLYIRLQELNLAEEYLLEAIELDPEYPDFYASLSELYWLRGCSRDFVYEERKVFLEKGVETARHSLEIDPEHVNSILYLIRNLLVFEGNSHIPELIELAQELLCLAPESAVAHEAYAQALIYETWERRKNKQDLNRILPILEESLRLNPNRPSPKILAYDLLKSHYMRLSSKGSLQNFFLIMVFAALPLSILTFYFYNTCGIQLFPTVLSVILTFISLTLMIDLTQSQMRIWSNLQYRKFLQPNTVDKVIYVFWLVFAVIAIIGFTWKILPIGLIRLITLLLWIALFMAGVFLFFIIRRSPRWRSRSGTIDPDISSGQNSSNIEHENINLNNDLKKNLPYFFLGIAVFFLTNVLFPTKSPNKKPLNQQSTTNYVVYPIATHDRSDDII
ncbi:tetratricopeptide repeat protein [Chamaesiphon sp. VAR_48_metabat_403]|uniref:tetratricopeptide repeat protein n=1 Tax=Chamaesiphon sp. VAR_48_metabat_403 TaxID=2964700 RepID=UPI00286E4A0E|nr:tetratricopeptide repeat protein [Chamaesiphon sp. VAR_48_metabat_403]